MLCVEMPGSHVVRLQELSLAAMEGEGGEAEPKPGAARQCPLKQVISVKTWDGEARRPVGDAGIVFQLVSEIGDEHSVRPEH